MIGAAREQYEKPTKKPRNKKPRNQENKKPSNQETKHKNKQEVLRRMYNGYSVAEKNGVADYISLYALGYFYNLNEQSNQAIKYFNKSLKLDSNYAPTHYNLAYLYTERDSNEAALYHAWKAYINYKYIFFRFSFGRVFPKASKT